MTAVHPRPPDGQDRGRDPPQILDAVEVVPASSVGGLLGLQALVLRIFGEGDRPHGWFARKLRREWIDPDLSVVAVRPDRPPTDPSAWCGYMLVGRPPSMGSAVRGAGSGVDPSAQRRGIGSAVLRGVSARAHAAGFSSVRLHSERKTMGFYRDRGYALVRPTITAVGFGRGPVAVGVPSTAQGKPTNAIAAPWDCVLPNGHEHVVAWLPDAWARTEPERLRFESWLTADGAVRAWCSREGAAWLVHRLTCPTTVALVDAANALLERLPDGVPVLLPDLTDDTPSTTALLDSGWGAAQRGAMMRRSLGV